MAIEALNSAVSYQAQTTRQAKPVQKTVVEDTEVTTTQGKAVSGDIAAGTRVGETERQDSQSGQNGSQNQQPSNEQLKKAVEQLNKSMPHSEAIFGFHEDLQETSINLNTLCWRVVGQSGLEPPTSRLSVVCSSQLSYWPIWWRLAGSNR